MKVQEFRKRIKPNLKIIVGDQIFLVKSVVKFRFDDGNFYIKCFLNNKYVLADDDNENIFVLVKEVKTKIKDPFKKSIIYDQKKFHFSYKAHAVAEEVLGEEIFKKGESESFWDYQAADGSYLSLGITDKTNGRMDFYGKKIKEIDLEK